MVREALQELFLTDKQRVRSITDEIPPSPTAIDEYVIPLPPLSRPTGERAGILHDAAYKNDTGLTHIAQLLFEYHGVVPVSVTEKISPVCSLRGFYNIENGGLVSVPIIEVFSMGN